MKITIRLLLTAAIGLACAWAQGLPTGSDGMPSLKGLGNTNATNTPVQKNQSPSSLGSRPRPVFVSGTVAMDDGSPVSGNLKIEAVCGDNHSIVGHTGATGDFGFQWDKLVSGFEDASSAGQGGELGVGITQYFGGGGVQGGAHTNCAIQLEAPGYTSSSARIDPYALLDRFDAGTLILHKTTSDEGYTVSPLSLKAPGGAKRNFNKGTDEVKAKKFKDAEASFQKAVAAYPQYADAWLSLGRVEERLKALPAAREDFQKAIDADNKLVGPWVELGLLASNQSNWADTVRYLDQAVKLDPISFPSAWYFGAIADFNLKQLEAAERNIRMEIKLDQNRNPRSTFLLGMILLNRNDLKGGVEALQSFLKVSPTGPDAEVAKTQLARAEAQTSK